MAAASLVVIVIALVVPVSMAVAMSMMRRRHWRLVVVIVVVVAISIAISMLLVTFPDLVTGMIAWASANPVSLGIAWPSPVGRRGTAAIHSKAKGRANALSLTATLIRRTSVGGIIL
ncbi:MAG TPA: hypothetical protein VM510_16275 [Caulifigura sp.]|nr:hypothetical protein [Caulifigura sp.]